MRRASSNSGKLLSITGSLWEATIKRILFIALLAVIAGLIMMVSIILTVHAILSLYAAGR